MATAGVRTRVSREIASVKTASVLLLAVVLGLLSADGWRWHLGPVDDLASAQGVWALGGWLTGLLLTRRRGLGALLGAGFPLVGLAAYYLYEWIAYDAHAATAQLAGSGPYWVVLSAVGGAVFGALGVVAGESSARRRFDAVAFAHALPAVAVLCEAGYVLARHNALGGPPFAVVTGLAVLGLLVLARGVRRTGARPMLVATLVMLVSAPLIGRAFLALAWQFGYLTL